jgi:hypothetical protein
MSMMDLQGALGGPPGGGPGAITIPGGGGPGGPGGPAGPGPDAGAAPPGPGGGDSIDFLDQAEEALHQFIQVDPDEVDRAEAAKALQIVLKLKASNQTDTQQGGMKSLARALSGGGGPPGAGPPGGGPPLG